MTKLIPRTVTLKEIQKASNLSLSWLRQLTRKGVLNGERRGRVYLYDAGEVNRTLGLKLQVREQAPCLEDVW
jgi:hypothetical protein